MNNPFERYRSNTLPFSIPRIIGGTVITLLVWVAVTFLAGITVTVIRDMSLLHRPQDFELWVMLAGFAGIWLGLSLAMRFMHGEPLGKLFGASRRLNRQDALKGFFVIILTAILAEFAVASAGLSTITRSDWLLTRWLAVLPLLAALTWIQTSAEELLFRGYLMRGIASRKRSAWAWAVIPSALFVLLHVQPGMTARLATIEVVGIASITALLVLVVVRTGNLGAAMGIHFGNNLFIFAILSHEQNFNAMSLSNGTATEVMVSTAAGFTAVLLVTIAAPALAALLLTDPRSPLRLNGDEP